MPTGGCLLGSSEGKEDREEAGVAMQARGDRDLNQGGGRRAVDRLKICFGGRAGHVEGETRCKLMLLNGRWGVAQRDEIIPRLTGAGGGSENP